VILRILPQYFIVDFFEESRYTFFHVDDSFSASRKEE